ncbi:hypothetical protein [Furfurilactobacillus entadae]
MLKTVQRTLNNVADYTHIPVNQLWLAVLYYGVMLVAVLISVSQIGG